MDPTFALSDPARMVSAILMSAGFFLPSLGRDVHRPNRLIVLLWAGVVVLAAGVVSLGIGLLTAG